MIDDNFKKKSAYDPLPEELKDNYKIGLNLQREIFKQANIDSNYDVMNKTLENIYNEIKSKVNDKQDIQKLKLVRNIIYWYYNIPYKYKKKTPEGYRVIFPPDIEIRINKCLNRGYQILINQLNKLKLL